MELKMHISILLSIKLSIAFLTNNQMTANLDIMLFFKISQFKNSKEIYINSKFLVYFYNIFRDVNSTGLWSTKGCDVYAAASNETHSQCKCDHLTNFAVLMQIKSDSDLKVNHVIM